jgi:signal peptidase I
VLKEPWPVDYARSFFPVLLVVLVLRSFIVEPFQIPSGSMRPTLEVGDFILVNKFTYGLRLPVVHQASSSSTSPSAATSWCSASPASPVNFIKRVVGLPGDRIRYADQALFINGERAGYELVGQFDLQLPFARNPIPVREYLETLVGETHSVYRYPFPEAPREWVVPENGYFMMGDNRGRSEDSRVWGFVPEAQIVGKAVAIWVHKDPGLAMPTFSRNRWLD